MPDKLTDKEILNPCYLCKHPNEKPNRRKHYKCNNEECEWLKCWARVKEWEKEINRLQAENERLKKDAKNKRLMILQLQQSNKYLKEHYFQYKDYYFKYKEELKTAKAEAYKEFAERLKKEQYLSIVAMVVSVEAIDNLLKELVGDK